MQLYLHESRRLLLLAIPVILAQLSQTGMGLVDTLMAGSYSTTDMAAVAMGTAIWLPAILFCQGLLIALTPVIAQLHGAGKYHLIASRVRQGFWLAGMLSVLAIVVLWIAGDIILQMSSINPQLAAKTSGYLRALSWGAPGYLFFQVTRGQCEGLAKTKPGMVVALLGLLVNIPVNYLFIYGRFGMPELGGVGCGVATATVYWMMFLLMLRYIKRSHSMRNIRNSQSSGKPELAILIRIIRLGLPIAMAMFFEVTLFTVVALLVAPLGVVAVAGHQIALNFSALMFMLPMSLAIAITIRTGYFLGMGDPQAARISAWSGIATGVCLATITAIITATLRQPIALLYNTDPSVVLLASHLILLAAIYQISDSIQVAGGGVLRGYKDTRPIFFITLISYWLLGLPVGYILTFTSWLTDPLGPAGFWYGFIIGLTTSAILMIWRICYIQRQPDSVILQRAAR